jgi:hypothetical protein
LGYLDIRNTKATEEGAVSLQEQIPKLRVYIDGRTDPLPRRGPSK